MKKVCAVLFFLWITPAMASDIQFDRTMTQQMFRSFSQEAGALIIYRAMGPADGDTRAGFAIDDLENQSVEFWRVPYDIEDVQGRMARAGLPEPLILRLSIGH